MARPMEFWGVEVKAGQPLKVNPGDSRILHLSQATLGESKNIKANDSVPVFVNFGGKKLVLGTLSPEKFPQLAFDLVFEKEFELSHNWKSGSVFFCGYTTVVQEEEDDFADEEDLPLNAENGKVGSGTSSKPSTAAAKPSTATDKPESSTKPKVTIVEPMKVDEEDSDDDDEEEEDGDEEDDEDEEGSDDSEADSDEEDSEEEETPKKAAEQGKKRPAESVPKTPVSDKKAKLTTPQKTGGKKGGHTATPHPAKQAGKAPVSVKQQTPKSDAKISCKSCNKSFNSENALQAHSKAKHGAK